MKISELFELEERSILSVMGEQPDHYNDAFVCSDHKLTSLKGAPSSVDGYFACHGNLLTSLKYAPSKISKSFYCYDNKLTTLEGAPSSIGGEFSCYKNKLTSLHNIHKQIKFIGGSADFQVNPIKSHVLGLLLIDGLKSIFIGNKQVQKIIDKHLKGERDVFACQEELIDAGFEDFAQL